MKVCTPSTAVNVFKRLGFSASKVRACRTPSNLRPLVISNHLGKDFERITGMFRYHLYCIAPDIVGVDIEYMELSNGGFYLSVVDSKVELGIPQKALVTWELGIRNQCQMSFDAASLVAMLMTYAELGGADLDDHFREHFDRLIEYAKCHSESEDIQSLTNMF